VCGEGFCLIWTKYYHGYEVKEDVFAQASEVYVRDDKGILQEFIWKSTKGRSQLENLDLSGRIILKWNSRRTGLKYELDLFSKGQKHEAWDFEYNKKSTGVEEV